MMVYRGDGMNKELANAIKAKVESGESPSILIRSIEDIYSIENGSYNIIDVGDAEY